MKRKKAKSGPQNSAPEKSLKPKADTVFVARDLLDNIARRLDFGVSSAVVCRLALSEQNADCDQDIATVLWSITDELQRQIERIDRITHIRSKSDHTKGDRRREGGLGEPANAQALCVPRNVLNDVRYRLSLVVGSTKVCRVALQTQNAERDVDVAAMLKHIVINIIWAQLQRIRAIANGRPEKRQRNARAAP
jgi:hypothetical protein